MATPTRALWIGICLLGIAFPMGARGQVNYTPLERGDYSEVEEKLIVLRGLEVAGEYGLSIRLNDNNDLPANDQGTDTYQDLRLNLNTVFHRDVAIHLKLELGKGIFSDNSLREAEEDNRGRLQDSQTTTVNAREAYLRYRFNPNSAILLGKHEVSIGDRRGKLFDAIVPAITFDCKIGTWCFPMGLAKTGPSAGDALYHFGLRYTAWNIESNGVTDSLQVEVFRVIYSEGNIPLGKNLGPGRFNPTDPSGAGTPDPSQYLEASVAGDPIYYDADSQDYYGIIVEWKSGGLFVNLDAIGHRGPRIYHTYRDPDGGVTTNLFSPNQPTVLVEVKSSAVELELGVSSDQFQYGLKFMTADGDRYVAGPLNQPEFNRGLNGFYEITPGSYRGSRLYFNGTDSRVDLGAGLGHSINNTQLIGVFIDVNKGKNALLEYSAGLYQLTYNEPIPNENYDLKDDIGIELNNLITWNLHKALKVQFEINAIKAGEAFRVDDFTRPKTNPNDFLQGIFRVIYGF